MQHPLDPQGKYRFIENDRILSVEVPVRTTPEIDSGALVRNVETYTVKTQAVKDLRYVYSAQEDGSKLKLLNPGDSVTVTLRPADSDRWKIKTGRVSGWIASDALDVSTKTEYVLPANASAIETVTPAWRQRLQLFRIYSVEWNSTGGVTAKARHISYDLMYNITKFDTDEPYSLTGALQAITTQCIDKVPFYFYTNISGTHTGAHYKDTDPITALLDPDDGLCTLWSAKLVRDNNELYLLDSAGLDRGVTLEYGKNLTGVTMTADMSQIATRIIPRGEYKDGSTLYLDEAAYPDGCVDSPLRAQYPIDRILTLDVTEAKESSDITVDIARQLMAEAAQKKYDAGGVDKPQVSVTVQFDRLGRTERYKQFADLDSVYLYDTVSVYHPGLGIDVSVDVVRTVWDCLKGKMQTVELGSLQALTSSVSSWQISSGVSGAKLINGSVDAAKVAQDAISARHIQADSINATAIQAGSVTAEKINAAELKADAAELDEIQAAWAAITGAYIGTLTAGSISTDTLAAALAQFSVITAGTATFDFATVQHLVAQALNLEKATGNKVFISNLSVDYASAVEAYLGRVCVKAEDGNFYQLNVGTDGSVSGSLVDVTEEEQESGKRTTGQPIVETSLTVSDLSATDIKAVYALINRIDAARIDVDTLTARAAFIDFLRTSNLASNETIKVALDNLQADADAASADLSDIRRYMEFGDDGLIQRVPGHVYYTQITESGFEVRSDKQVDAIATMSADAGVKAERVTLGQITCKATSTGGWVWQEVDT